MQRSGNILKVVGTAVLCCVLSAAAGAQNGADLPQAPAPSRQVLERNTNNGVLRVPADILIPKATPGALSLSIDHAIQLGLEHNVQIELSLQNQRRVSGEVLTVKNALLPTVTAEASTGTREINLAAMGFKPALVASFGLPNFDPIVKVDVTSAQLNVHQQLFNIPAYYLYRSAQKAEDAASYATLNARGTVALLVGSQYLKALADQSQIQNAQALLEADTVELQQAVDSHDAGVGTHLDVLRAQVELQQQQQVLIQYQNAYEKDKIQLNRYMGLPADQELRLTDPVPYQQLTELPLLRAKAVAYQRRKDYLQLLSELEVAERSRKAVKFEYAPTVSFGGFYGVIGQTHGLYHGDFSAQGIVNIPIFHEAEFRGEREVAESQVTGIRQQIASLRDTIDEQIREAMLDVESSQELVRVARSNVGLARQVLQDATDRFQAGVDDNLPVVQAQATLAGAEARLTQSLYQYNTAKLTLARNIGVVETQYKSYLGN